MLGTFLIAIALSTLASAAPKPSEVTFYRDVLPVLQARCQTCHRPGEAAPMPLLTYQDARPWAKAMKAAVLGKKMPPWHGEPAGRFENERRLSEAETRTISDWADTGAKAGNSKYAPPAPLKFADGWTIGKPDTVIEMPNEFRVPATGTVDYSWIVVPTGFTEDKWVEKLEVRPGNRSVVHHVVVMARPPKSPYMRAAQPGIPFMPARGTPRRRQQDETGTLSDLAFSEVVGVYVPGGDAYLTRPGQARMIPAGSDIVFQMHYTANGKEATDRTRVGIVFAKEPPKERVVNTFIMNTSLRIPPGAADHEVRARVTIHEDATLMSLFPHMHVRGKAFEYRVVFPDGRTETLLTVPRYDFNWQTTYYLREPLMLPKGTRIECIARYDNSPNNKANPDPASEVLWGDQTWEEMLAGFVDFAVPLGVNPMRIARPAPAAQSSGGN